MMSSTAAQASARHADRCPVHPAVGEDPGQHRERGDRHRDARGTARTASGATGPLGSRRAWVKHERQPGARARTAAPPTTAEMVPASSLPAADQHHVQLEPDDEHEQHQPELGEDAQVRAGPPAGTALVVQIARQQPQQDWGRARCRRRSRRPPAGWPTVRASRPKRRATTMMIAMSMKTSAARCMQRPQESVRACGWRAGASRNRPAGPIASLAVRRIVASRTPAGEPEAGVRAADA